MTSVKKAAEKCVTDIIKEKAKGPAEMTVLFKKTKKQQFGSAKLFQRKAWKQYED